jgi:hypothetical protein
MILCWTSLAVMICVVDVCSSNKLKVKLCVSLEFCQWLLVKCAMLSGWNSRHHSSISNMSSLLVFTCKQQYWRLKSLVVCKVAFQSKNVILFMISQKSCWITVFHWGPFGSLKSQGSHFSSSIELANKDVFVIISSNVYVEICLALFPYLGR